MLDRIVEDVVEMRSVLAFPVGLAGARQGCRRRC